MPDITLSDSPTRNPIVLAIWREYHARKSSADAAQSEIDAMPAHKRDLENIVSNESAIMRECLDVLSQWGENVGRIPNAEDIAEDTGYEWVSSSVKS